MISAVSNSQDLDTSFSRSSTNVNILKTTNESLTFNLRRHLVIQHQIYIGINANFDRKKKKTSENCSVAIITKERREEIDRSFLNCIVRGGLSYNHFSHPWYEELFDILEPGYKAPDRRTFQKRIEHQYHTYINELKRLLPKDRPIAFTTDNRKISKNLNEYIGYELNRFGLKDCLHASITTDNANEMKAATAFDEFGPHFPCIAHIFNLIINHGLCIWKEPNENRYSFKPYHKNKVVEDDEDESVEAEQIPDDIKLDNNKQLNQSDNITISSDIGIPSPVLPTTDLQEDEFISDDDEEESNDIPSVLSSSIDNINKQILEIQHKTHHLVIRTRKLVGIMRSVVIDQYVRNHENSPKNGFILDVQIRWNSTFFMLQRVIHHQLVVRSVFIYKFPTITAVQKSLFANAYLDYDQWNLMQALHDVLALFEMATRSLAGKHYVTLALAYTTINIIRFGLQSKENDSSYLALLKKSILAQSELHFDIEMTKIQKELMIIYIS
ncbi:unnamed protein product [Rotaria sordida]|uniref:Uncharacterized protein n=2 Tax=Rotaria sordida TaxID=392033 RepID=A0A813VNW6_9BILA|nr:unnamed protein product [Rotaria sordida]